MLLILLATAALFAFYASRTAPLAARAIYVSPALSARYASPNLLLAVDALWSTGGRATGPAIRTPAGGPGRSRPAP
jgi:hypothetical protein